MKLFGKIFSNNKVNDPNSPKVFNKQNSHKNIPVKSVIDELDFIKVDLSFIPINLIPQKLNTRSKEKLIITQHDEDYFKYFLDKKIPIEKIAPLIHQVTEFKQNFWEFEKDFQDFIDEQIKNRNYKLAESCADYLFKLGSTSIKTFEIIIQIYSINENLDGKNFIKNLINEELSKKETLYPRNQLNKLIFHSNVRLFSNNEIWKLFNKQISIIDKLDEHSVIYEVMGDIILSERKSLDALYKYIISYCTFSQYIYLLDTSLNSNEFEKHKTNDVIRGHLKKYIKRTKFENKDKAIISLVEKYLINLPKIDLINLGEELKNILTTK